MVDKLTELNWVLVRRIIKLKMPIGRDLPIHDISITHGGKIVTWHTDGEVTSRDLRVRKENETSIGSAVLGALGFGS